ncbi:O-antigen ligase family protein, partial [Klebsiella aerogenes]|uniref:O-antigen ligase family protein n=1 Tax=Klebsiella aerogenes TaxID=548 RepID=UPI00387818D2
MTLSGRVSIWFEVIKDWQNNPIFGYGPDYLDVEHRLRLGMLFAFHAHNQFIQTLGQSGLV